MGLRRADHAAHLLYVRPNRQGREAAEHDDTAQASEPPHRSPSTQRPATARWGQSRASARVPTPRRESAFDRAGSRCERVRSQVCLAAIPAGMGAVTSEASSPAGAVSSDPAGITAAASRNVRATESSGAGPATVAVAAGKEAAAGTALDDRLIVSASISKHNPPNSSTWTPGSLNASLLGYNSGAVSASASAPAGAHCRPASLPTRPPNVRIARPPSTGMTTAPPPTPLVQNPLASSMGSPASTAGTTECP